MSANEDFENALTRHQIYLQRLGTGTARKVLDALKASETRIVDRLMREDMSALSRTRMEKLLTDLRRVIEGAYVDATGVLQVDLDALAVYEGEFQTDLFKRVVPVQFETVTPSANQVIAAVNSRPFQGKLLKEVYPELAASAWRAVRNSIRGGFIEGRTTDQIVRELRGTAAQGYKDGVLAKNRRDVESVVRTAVNHTANTAREVTYEQNDDLIKGIKFNATLDGRTTLICASNDGKVFKIGKGPRPPLHFNCRSSTSPVMKSWRELGFDVDDLPPGTRASMDGQVPADQDYDAWLRKQPKGFQDDVLGKRKGELFRGGLKMDRFVDKSGEELTLDQLRKRERDIWEKTA
ncbi:MAG: minor capsid protein [Paracoccaceae bacterium]